MGFFSFDVPFCPLQRHMAYCMFLFERFVVPLSLPERERAMTFVFLGFCLQ